MKIVANNYKMFDKFNSGVTRGLALLFSLSFFLGGCPGGDGGGGGQSLPSTDYTQVSGKINAPLRFQIESDTNDPNNSPILGSNNTDPQPVSNMTVVMGYAEEFVDDADQFVLHLNDGESVMLDVCESNTVGVCDSSTALSIADLDLYLYSGATIVDSSTNPARVDEKLTVSAGGTYVIEVKASTEGTNYILSTSSGDLMTASSGYYDNADFVIGEALVKFKSPANITKSSKGLGISINDVQKTASDLGITVKKMRKNGNAKIGLQLGPNSSSVAKKSMAAASASIYLDTEQAKKETLKKIKELEKHPDIEWAEPNLIVSKTANYYNDAHYAYQWMIDSINLESAWDGTTISGSTVTGQLTGDSVIVAVIDTGVVIGSGSTTGSPTAHPDIINSILKDGATVVGYDFVSALDDLDGDFGIDPNPDDPGDRIPGERSSFHGTHVAGIIAAQSNNAKSIAGVAGGAKIMPIRALGYLGDGDIFDVAQSILWAAGLETSYGNSVEPAQVGGTDVRADIINLSLGGSFYSSYLRDATDDAREAGVIIIAAAGNNHSSAEFYPAANRGVVGVSATDQFNDFVSSYSNYGTYIDLAGPGGDTSQQFGNTVGYGGVISLWADDGNTLSTIEVGDDYCAWYQGTSMAAPHIAGVAALMIEAYNKVGIADPFSPDDFDQLIEGTYDGATTDRITSITNKAKGDWDNEYGYGLIDAKKAIDNAVAFANLPRLRFGGVSLYFGFNQDEMTVSFQNAGPGTADSLGDISIEAAQMPTWMSGYTVDYGPYELTIYIDRAGIENGSYASYGKNVLVDSSLGGSYDLGISMLVGSTNKTDVGTVYVIYKNTKTGVTYQAMTSYADNYNYDIRIREGTYIVYAGTDVDNDAWVGDNGEVYGELVENQTFGNNQTITGIDIDLKLVSDN